MAFVSLSTMAAKTGRMVQSNHVTVNTPSYVAVAQAESPRFVNVAAEVAGPCSVDTAQSGTESFNCP
ncbi:hypothetical protein MJN47_30480, partial [Salmonella enterica subsp. enterica serovar Lubbock]|nr:hypothetical protein [Salmonella enterica subsp. enterica serovar Lubbock]